MSYESNDGVRAKQEYYFSEPANINIEVSSIPGLEFFYNAAAWEIDGYIYLLGRFVEKPGGVNEPDIGVIVLAKLTPGLNIVSKEVVKIPNDKEFKVEDPRIIIVEKELGLSAIIACTVVQKNENGDSIPYIGIIETEPDKIMDSLPTIEPIRELGKGSQSTPIGELDNSLDDIVTAKGKNGIPIDPSTPNLFIFRPEGDENDHRLVIFERTETGTTIMQSIDLTGIPWAQRRIGTTMPPIWISENEALFPIHGITMENDICIYSIGFAMLRKEITDGGMLFSIDSITMKPVVTPDKVVENGIEITELHPDQRRVVYCCGGLPNFDKNGKIISINMFINIGDRETISVVVNIADYLDKNSKHRGSLATTINDKPVLVALAKS